MIKIKRKPTLTHFAKAIRSLRLMYCVTQQEVASAIGVDRSSYAYYESGKVQPSLETLIDLARYFRVSVDYLLYGKTGGGLFLPPPSLASRKYLSYNRYIPNGKSPGMKFHLPVLAVQDVKASKKFYQDLFAQDVVLDLGKNVIFSGGFHSGRF